ncbi:hypothetical protein HK101_007393 [Irineochytrium annulatum]|nr:hypothetical protein HK101_007393 [Irineochytrium annulatum]
MLLEVFGDLPLDRLRVALEKSGSVQSAIDLLLGAPVPPTQKPRDPPKFESTLGSSRNSLVAPSSVQSWLKEKPSPIKAASALVRKAEVAVTMKAEEEYECFGEEDDDDEMDLAGLRDDSGASGSDSVEHQQCDIKVEGRKGAIDVAEVRGNGADDFRSHDASALTTEVASSTLINAFSLLKQPTTPTRPPPHLRLTAATISSHLPCELYSDFLPPDLALSCLRFLMHDAPTWAVPKYYINNKAVTSNHKSAFFVEAERVGGAYMWAGEKAVIRVFSDEMRRVRDLVQAKVRERIRERERAGGGGNVLTGISGKFEWTGNVAVANEYRNGKEITGAHTDKLTHIGPRPVIASITLGAGRMFRIKRNPRPAADAIRETTAGAVQSIKTEPGLDVGAVEDIPADPHQTYNVHLAHGSLLIMFAPLQEEYKHEIPPQRTVRHHPIAGEARYNLTYRFFRPDFATPPKCRCKVDADLKPVLRQEKSLGRYYFGCTFGREPVGCGFFEWLEKGRG